MSKEADAGLAPKRPILGLKQTSVVQPKTAVESFQQKLLETAASDGFNSPSKAAGDADDDAAFRVGDGTGADGKLIVYVIYDLIDDI
jgi:hypothetical protein